MRLALCSLTLTLIIQCGSSTGPAGDGIRQEYFPSFASRPNLHEPPQEALLLWLEGNAFGTSGDYLRADGTGAVLNWHDVRGGRQGIVVVAPFVGRQGGPRTGQKIEARISTPAGRSYAAYGLRCGDPDRSDVRCSYAVVGPDGTAESVNLDGSPYTILAVVRRTSGRGDNYFVMTNGRGCNVTFGGTGCEDNTALHLGWSGERTIRLGQYGNDVFYDPAPAFNAGSPPLSLFVAVAGPGEGKTVALLEPGFNLAKTVRDDRPLTNSNRLFVGGTPWGSGSRNRIGASWAIFLPSLFTRSVCRMSRCYMPKGVTKSDMKRSR